MASACAAVALLLSACGGGGGEAAVAVAPVNIGVVVGGTSYAPVPDGPALDVVAAVGQSVEFDANEPVVWAFSVNGSPLFANGTTVDVGGVTISQVQFDPSRVVLQSSLYGPAVLPIDVDLTATSTIDAAQVAFIHLRFQ